MVVAPDVVQAQAYFAPLSTPPASVGTCRPVDTQRMARRDTTHVVAHRLVIMSAPPGRSREILVVARPGRLAYSDMTHTMTSVTSSTGGDVVAVIDSLGRVHGYHIRSTSVLPASAARLPTNVNAELQNIRDSTRTTTSHVPLTAAEQARVRAMTTWMQKRCP